MKKIRILFHENVLNNIEKKIHVYRYNTLMAVWCILCGKFITSNATCKIKNDKFRKYLISRYLVLLNLFYSNVCLVVVAVFVPVEHLFFELLHLFVILIMYLLIYQYNNMLIHNE